MSENNQTFDNKTIESNGNKRHYIDNDKYHGSCWMIMFVICTYSLSSSMFFPITKSLIYQKVCIQQGYTELECRDRKDLSSNYFIQTETNNIFMIVGVIFSIIAIFSSICIGKLSDDVSRKYALIVPFIGLIFSDLILLSMANRIEEKNQHLFAVSEIIFSFFGGYMTIFASAFSYISQATCAIGLGSTLGFFFGSFFGSYEYTDAYLMILITHFFCILMIFLAKDMTPEPDDFNKTSILNETLAERIQDRFTGWRRIFWDEDGKRNIALFYTTLAFFLSFLALMGSNRILFFFLKNKFYWDAGEYSKFKMPMQCTATFFAIVIYPLLKNSDVKDSTLALLGLIARGFGRLLIAIAWNDSVIYSLVVLEAFNKFSPSGMRSMMAQTVYTAELGRVFSLISVVEAFGNLLSVLIFHSLYNFTITFMPELSFIIMAIICVPAVFLIILADEAIQKLVKRRLERQKLMEPKLIVKVEKNIEMD
ncbi:Major facilitator superfamily domain, general substrate transporter-containing protein [Strongyloides ratti]|uniref:Major facilitator superfamily domain, general substrate transporter-containing protein n=1 Tax=Strongyloides ratti TaxID=34506 RepID=A0A090LHQ5_STRRB|nr:Major facilitator superfamily domain, general substrate transporter-containing protein [Strongyloides ratti]CEF69262.1 Major facilitator superfamily domain, general substrate transporter-containing protein [Strongyloides ratti]